GVDHIWLDERTRNRLGVRRLRVYASTRTSKLCLVAEASFCPGFVDWRRIVYMKPASFEATFNSRPVLRLVILGVLAVGLIRADGMIAHIAAGQGWTTTITL